jgi:transposase
MQELQDQYDCCAGIDVHKQSVSVCVLSRGKGKAAEGEVRNYGTTTRELVDLSLWLQEQKVEKVVMESTGVYWKPVRQVLESEQIEAIVANAQHVKNVPGRKTDTADCAWLATLLKKGLVRASLVPTGAHQQLRDLSRSRVTLVQDRARAALRIQKLLEEANVKLASVATDVLGVSGRAMLKALASGETDPQRLAQLAKGKLKKKLAALGPALEGRIQEHQRFMLGELLGQVEELERRIARYQEQIELVVEKHFKEEVKLVRSIKGVERIAAAAIVGEIGIDMTRFPTARHLCSWGGLCPGNHESGGKRKSGRTRKGNPWFRRVMTQVAWAASHSKNTYLATLYRKLAPRRGKKRAVLAVANAMAGILWYMLSRRVPYKDLGADYYEKVNGEHLRRYYIRKLQKLGLKVQVEPIQIAA